MATATRLSETDAVWFEELVGFAEAEVDDVARHLTVEGDHLTSEVNGRTFRSGRFETPSLAELRDRLARIDQRSGSLTVREVVAGAAELHTDPDNAGALFQVASQFNALEMISPSVTPEDGVDRYASDPTQGPACAVACGAGTIYRNYLVPLPGRIGQSATDQIDCLADLAAGLGVGIEMRNGYALPSEDVLTTIADRLAGLAEPTRDEVAGALRIGMQWHTEVTLDDAGHVVSQAYCSALPVSYGEPPVEAWEPFARLVLDAAYEATLAAAVLNRHATDNRRVYLTLLGGGVFGNRIEWIVDAAGRAIDRVAEADLDVAVVSYREPNPAIGPLLSRKADRSPAADAAMAFHAAINDRDLPALVALMAPDHRFVDSAGSAVDGRAACAGAWASFFESFPGYRDVVDSLREPRPGEVVTIGRSECSFAPLDGPATWHATVVDGLVTEWRVEDPGGPPT